MSGSGFQPVGMIGERQKTIGPRRTNVVLAVAGWIALTGCDRGGRDGALRRSGGEPVPAVEHLDLESRLGEAEMALAEIDLAEFRHGGAILHALKSLEVAPDQTRAREFLRDQLTKWKFHSPALSFEHALPVRQLVMDGESLWVAVADDRNRADGFSTLVRWDLNLKTIEAVLFPTPQSEILTLRLSPDAKRMVITRRNPGGRETSLLLDAMSLEPLATLKLAPQPWAADGLMKFSPDGLLLAYPSAAGTWVIADAASGETLREDRIGAADKETVQDLAAVVDRGGLMVCRSDGGIWKIPLVSTSQTYQLLPDPPSKFRFAAFAEAGSRLAVVVDGGPHAVSEAVSFQLGETDAGSEFYSLRNPRPLVLEDAEVDAHPWHHSPSVWNGVLARAEISRGPVVGPGGQIAWPLSDHARLHQDGKINAVASADGRTAVGLENGLVTIHAPFPRPQMASTERPISRVEPAMIKELERFFTTLCYDHLPLSSRLDAWHGIDREAVAGAFPELDLDPLFEAIDAAAHLSPAADGYQALWERLALADGSRKSWPRWLEAGRWLADSAWHQDLGQALWLDQQPASAEVAVDSERSPWAIVRNIEREIDANRSTEAVAMLDQLAEDDSRAAGVLRQALETDDAAVIRACLTKFSTIPPLVTRLANAQLAATAGDQARALAIWPQPPPDLLESRLTSDWHGWEHEDFQPAADSLSRRLRGTLDLLELPEDPAPEARAELVARLLDPASESLFGRVPLAAASLRAAEAFAVFGEESAADCHRLASLALVLGADPMACLRQQAAALTTMQRHEAAHAVWIDLITVRDPEFVIPGDFIEAGYSAIEVQQFDQCLEILAAGVRRFPEDAGLALQAGWLLLAIDRTDSAHAALQHGLQIGYADSDWPNALALLTVASQRAGFERDANDYFDELIALDPAWMTGEPPEIADWPEEMRATLLQVRWWRGMGGTDVDGPAMDGPAMDADLDLLLPE